MIKLDSFNQSFDSQAVEHDRLTNIPLEVCHSLVQLTLGHVVPVFLCQDPETRKLWKWKCVKDCVTCSEQSLEDREEEYQHTGHFPTHKPWEVCHRLRI